MADDTSVVSVSQISCGSSHSCALLSKCLADVPRTLARINRAALCLFSIIQHPMVDPTCCLSMVDPNTQPVAECTTGKQHGALQQALLPIPLLWVFPAAAPCLTPALLLFLASQTVM
jgi:hypothetical protein